MCVCVWGADAANLPALTWDGTCQPHVHIYVRFEMLSVTIYYFEMNKILVLGPHLAMLWHSLLLAVPRDGGGGIL